MDAAGQFFLRALILINVALERLGLFDCVEVFALDVFDDRQLGHLPVVDFANQDGHLAPVGCLGGTQAALAGDEFVVVADEADDQRLQNAVGADAIGQIGDLGFFECLARLVRVANDRFAVEPGLAVLVARDSDVAGHVDRGWLAECATRYHPRHDPTGLPNHVLNVVLSTRPILPEFPVGPATRRLAGYSTFPLKLGLAGVLALVPAVVFSVLALAASSELRDCSKRLLIRRLSVIGMSSRADRIDLVQEDRVCLVDAFFRRVAQNRSSGQFARIASKRE